MEYVYFPKPFVEKFYMRKDKLDDKAIFICFK